MSWPRSKVQPIEIDGLRIDASLSETHTYAAEVTEYPVESGGVVVDHVRLMPIEVKIEGVVSDTPIGAVADQRLASRQTIEVEGRDPVDITPRPIELARDWLEETWRLRQPTEITTSLNTYTDMVMTMLEFPRDAEYGEAVRFNATFRQIQRVDVLRTTIRTATPGSGKKKSAGATAPPTKLMQAAKSWAATRRMRVVDAKTGVWQDLDTGKLWKGAVFSKRDKKWLFYEGEEVDDSGWNAAGKTFVEEYGYEPVNRDDRAIEGT